MNLEVEDGGDNLLPYEVTLAAVEGDALAMSVVMQHYERYIAYYSLKKIYDEYGNTFMGVDEDKVNRLTSKLIRAILDFKV